MTDKHFFVEDDVMAKKKDKKEDSYYACHGCGKEISRYGEVITANYSKGKDKPELLCETCSMPGKTLRKRVFEVESFKTSDGLVHTNTKGPMRLMTAEAAKDLHTWLLKKLRQSAYEIEPKGRNEWVVNEAEFACFLDEGFAEVLPSTTEKPNVEGKK